MVPPKGWIPRKLTYEDLEEFQPAYLIQQKIVKVREGVYMAQILSKEAKTIAYFLDKEENGYMGVYEKGRKLFEDNTTGCWAK